MIFFTSDCLFLGSLTHNCVLFVAFRYVHVVMFSVNDKSVFLHQVLNEVVVDRGPSSYLSNLDLFLDGHLITTVQGDG